MFLNKKIKTPYALLILSLFFNSCTGIKKEIRHKSSGFFSSYSYKMDKPFSEYIKETRQIIAESIKFKNIKEKTGYEKIIEANSPFEFYPNKKKNKKIKSGILLIHGLTDSPFIMRDIGKYFQDKSFLVRAILLPGHGTIPGDLTDIKYKQWIEAVKYGINSFENEIENLYIAGFSTGGALALYFALNPEQINKKIKGIILLSPAVKIVNETLIKHIKLYEKLGWKWLSVAKDKDIARYESFCLNAAYQVYLLTAELKGEKKIEAPVIMALSQDDPIVEPNAAKNFFEKRINVRKKIILYKNNPSVNKKRYIEERESRYSNQNILNFSHISLPISPDNYHYGKNGDYKHCLRYLKNKQKSVKCLDAKNKDIAYGSLNLKEDVFRRLTYNPDFKNMCDTLYNFIMSSDAN
ncbi:MAG: alpha/beta hydrolase [Deltaproteobacteria bacterium]|nr:alpha/beta hydrolase [Deltaproteobacteria bacterium]